MNFKELYNNNRKAIEEMLSAMWCGEAHDARQKKYAEAMKGVIKELFAPSGAVPVVQCMNLYKAVHSVSADVAKGLVGDLWRMPFPPYEHQYQCWNTLLNKKTPAGKPMSIVVTTGTGSGKTECFMMPLVQDLIKVGRSNQIQAIFLYPLNALMEDQKERLEKMLEGTNLTYAVYNGDLPDNEPKPDDTSDYAQMLRKRISQIRGEYKDANNQVKYKFARLLYTREQIRNTPPNILLTNPTMLEYILLRQADATLINPLQKSLRWVVIDETHSYNGAGAAELAMLLRRVLLAFDVKAEDVRFATSSATFGNAKTPEEAEQEKTKIREFIGKITGVASEQVEVVGGVRIGEEAISENEDKELWKKICRNDYISLDELFLQGTISDKLGKLEEMCQREEALSDKPDAWKMKAKVHYFYRVPNNGLYVRLTEHKDGCLKIYSNAVLNEKENKPPMLELTRCKHCGGYVAVALYDNFTGVYEPLDLDESDMFDVEGVLEEILSKGVKRPIMLGLKNDDIEMGDCNVMFEAKGNKLENVVPGKLRKGEWYVVGNTNYGCPYCNAKLSKRNDDSAEETNDFVNELFAQFQRFRLSAEVISRYLAPSILDQLDKNANSGDGIILHDGQQYISFVDNRQAAATSTLKQNLEQEKMWVYSTIFHELCRRKASEEFVRAEIARLKKLRNEATGDEEDEKLSNEITKLRAKLSGCIGWMEIFELLFNDKYCDVFCKFFVKRSSNSEETDSNGEITAAMKTKYVHSIMAECLAYHPKSAPSPETMGLFYVTYPQLNKAKLPESVGRLNELISDDSDKISEQDWRDLLQIFLNYTVRSNQSLFFKLADGTKLDIFGLKRFATEKQRRRPVSCPHIDLQMTGSLSRYAVYLGALISGSNDMVQIRNAIVANIDAVNAVLDDIWNTLTREVNLLEWGQMLNRNEIRTFERERHTEGQPEPYRMNLVNFSFKLYDKVRMCDVNGGEKVKCLRPVETVFKGLSLYPTSSGVQKIEGDVEEWELYPYFCGSNKAVDAETLKKWVETNRRGLCVSGLWGENGLYKNKLNNIYMMPNLFIQAEHTAQVDKEVSRTLQSEFKKRSINILACSTTMEMGVDLGNLELVLLSSVPPMPANYKQRAGRSGRNNKVRSACLTLCGSDAVGMRTLFNPMEHIISRPIAVPKVDLLSEQVVKRHVNSYLVRSFGVFGDVDGGGSLGQKVVDFFTPYRIGRDAGKVGRWIVVDPSNGRTILPDCGLGNQTGTRYQQFINMCDNAAEVAKVKNGLVSLLRETCFAGEENVGKVVEQARDTLVRCYGELSVRAADIKWAYDNQKANNQKFKAKLEIQYLELMGERLINYWATHRFTPNANMPVNVLALDLDSSRGIFTTNFSSNPSYSLREAISQYVPGNSVVVDGIVYKVSGIEFRNMYNPVNTFKRISHNSECVRIDDLVPDAIPWPINAKTELTLVSPTGFIPDFNEDYTRIIDKNIYTHVSAQLIGATDWTGDESVKMISVRTNREDSGDANILYYNEGMGYGYCFCSKCGRIVLESEPAPNEDVAMGLPAEMNNKQSTTGGAPNYHLAMNGQEYRTRCVGSNPQNGIYRNVIIGDLIQTDYSELRLRTAVDGKWIGSREGYWKKLLYTLAIAFSQSLVEVLGKERGAVDFAITPTGRICIFDTSPGGAGYSNQLKDEAILNSVIVSSRNMLKEAKKRNASDILLDKYTVRYLKQIDVDGAISWLNSFKL